MYNYDTIEMLSFNIKLMGRKAKRNVLISAGKISDKEKLLESIRKLSDLNVSIYATRRTSEFLTNNGIQNNEIFKISESKEPNIKQFLKENKLDLVINILTGNHNYDENSDSNLIRFLSIENGIPLITDTNVAIMVIDQMLKDTVEGNFRYKTKDITEPWNLKHAFYQLVNNLNGFACYHAHFDKAYLISKSNLKLSQVDMQKKWELYKFLKESYTHEGLIERISRGVEKMIEQGVSHCRTFVDADSTVKLMPIRAALEVKSKYIDKINLEIGVQPLQGVLDKESRKYFNFACDVADVIGGLPSKDRPYPEKHLDYIMAIAKDMHKPLDVHIDQENNPYENETELLALKTIEHSLQGRVLGIHAISLASKPKTERIRIINLVKEAAMGIIICPSAALSMKSLKFNAPIHNSIAPLQDLLDRGVSVYLGVDNIYDLFMPFVDGDIWFECRMLMEATRYYNMDKVAHIACDKTAFNNHL